MKTMNRSLRAIAVACLLVVAVPAAQASWLSDRTGVHINLEKPLEPKLKVDWNHPYVKENDALVAGFVAAGIIIAASGGIEVITIGPVLAAP
jgi:hypothetical protein